MKSRCVTGSGSGEERRGARAGRAARADAWGDEREVGIYSCLSHTTTFLDEDLFVCVFDFLHIQVSVIVIIFIIIIGLVMSLAKRCYFTLPYLQALFELTLRLFCFVFFCSNCQQICLQFVHNALSLKL